MTDEIVDTYRLINFEKKTQWPGKMTRYIHPGKISGRSLRKD